MSIYQLPDEIAFPSPEKAEPDGLLAVGGDLSAQRLIAAYSLGIFPWYSDGEPILWWSPDPRMVLFPKDFRVSKTLRKVANNGKFEIKFDTAFADVIEMCASVSRIDQEGETWITQEMKEAYINLHKKGIAHSVETYTNGKLVGGLYGLSLGGCFFGESMFHTVTDASKVALYHLVNKLTEWNFDLIDVQQETRHLKSLGAIPIERKDFLPLLNKSMQRHSIVGKWEYNNSSGIPDIFNMKFNKS